MTSDLYQSGWKPRGVRKDWERCSMTLDSTAQVLGDRAKYANGTMQEAVAWFDADGRCRALVADYDSGRRLTLRQNGAEWTIKVGARP